MHKGSAHTPLRPITKNSGLPKLLRWSHALRSDQFGDFILAFAKSRLTSLTIGLAALKSFFLCGKVAAVIMAAMVTLILVDP